jgi:hypothetical protein
MYKQHNGKCTKGFKEKIAVTKLLIKNIINLNVKAAPCRH